MTKPNFPMKNLQALIILLLIGLPLISVADTQVTFIDKDLNVEKLPTMSKKEVTPKIINKIKSLYEGCFKT